MTVTKYPRETTDEERVTVVLGFRGGFIIFGPVVRQTISVGR